MPPDPGWENCPSIAQGGLDLRTAYLGSLLNNRLLRFVTPAAGIEPVHWRETA
jgi:hypothetical protein